MAEPRRDTRLDQPREPGRLTLPRFDAEAFGRWSEAIARFMGTAKFLVYMTVFIVAVDRLEHARAARACGSTRTRSRS